MSRTRWARVAAITVATLAAWSGAFSAPARAASATNHNTCQYGYDGYWRDMDVITGGTPSVANATPGTAITLSTPTVDAALPDWLAEYGYNFQLLHEGRNELPVKVWVAIRATNTVEGVQYQQFETTAETTITTAGGTFADATPIEYKVPALAAMQWTARGGPIEFRQGGSGSLPQLPVGPGGRLQQVKGSFYVQATLGQLAFGLDCVPGIWIARGEEKIESASVPFATVDAPSFSCLSALPAAGNVASVRVDYARERGLPPTPAGQPYAYAPTVDYRLSSDYLKRLFDAGRLTEGDNTVALKVTGAVDGAVLSGTEQATVAVSDAGATIPEVSGSVRLSSWTGTPTSTLGFVPGTLGALSVDGVSGTVAPYGSLYARLAITPPGGSVNRLSLDCVGGTVQVAGGSPPAYSERGNQAGGDQGRYVIARYPLDAFATAFTVPAVSEQAAPTPTPTAIATVAPTAVPTVAPTPTPVAGKASVRSTRLKVASRRVAVSLRCTGATTCKGTVRLRSASKFALGAKRAKKIVSLTGLVEYSVKAGATASVKLALSADGRSLLAARQSLRVSLEVKPSSGSPTAKRTLTLTR